MVAIVCKCRIEFPNSHSIVWVYIYTHKQNYWENYINYVSNITKTKEEERILIISSSGMYSVFSRSSVLDYSILLLLLSY